MSGTYNPDDGAVPQAPWNITFLSQRDVALSIPINYVTAPGVSVTAACFADQHYEDDLFTQCLSNLFAAGFRRTVFDIYWDVPRRTWSFCPVQIPLPGTQPEPTSTTPTSSSTNPSLTPSSSTSYIPPTANASVRQVIRQELESFSSESSRIAPSSGFAATITVGVITTSSSTRLVLPTSPAVASNNSVLYSIGPYICSPSLNLDILIRIMADFLTETDDTLAAVLKYVTFNVHAAALAEDPEGAARAPDADSLPSAEELIGNLFKAQVSDYLYTPNQLQYDRTNLRSTWEMARNETAPDPAYYNVTTDGLQTPNGWPNEEYMEFEKVERLLIGFQSISPQMADYDVDGDSSTMFAPGNLVDYVNATLTASGSVGEGCFFKKDDTSILSVNDSWAVYDDVVANDNFNAANLDNQNDNILPEVNALVSCGVSPILNVTLGNSTANDNYTLYANFVRSSIWSWAPGEPRSPTSAPADDSSSNKNANAIFRCAVFNASSTTSAALSGRWHVRSCQERYHAACRANGRPHVWAISPDVGFYSQISDNCPPHYQFAVPRTALENQYLLQACRKAGIGVPGTPNSAVGISDQNDNDNGDGSTSPGAVWLNFNSLQAQDCWVAGVNATCPYVNTTNDNREILVPTVAAIVVLVLALLMLLVKCGANRRRERKRTRTLHGWDYEGVPS